MKYISKQNFAHWWQLAWRWIEQLVDSKLLHIVAPSSAEKEVVNVADYASLEAIDEEDRDMSVIYICAEENRLYIWNGSEFTDVTNQAAENNSIFVNKENLIIGVVEENDLDAGIYTAFVGSKGSFRTYTLTINVHKGPSRIGRPTTIYKELILSDNNGWADVQTEIVVQANAETGDMETVAVKSWNWHYYSYKGDEIATDKEVINVLTASEEAPESAEDGDLYINTDEHNLYEWQEDDWVEIAPSGSVVYLASDNGHIYVYVNDEFADATGEEYNHILYVSNLTNDLAGMTENGIYTVMLVDMFSAKAYTLAVTTLKGPGYIGRPSNITTTQTVQNYEGYMVRTKTNNGEWSEWEEFRYLVEAIGDDEINSLFTH